MAAFRFRAQAALDLRRREHEQALRELARAESEQQQARTQVDDAKRAASDARRTADEAMRTPSSVAELHWHRSWIVRLDREHDTSMTTLAMRDRDVELARQVCVRTRQRQESLERFREKALAAFRAAEADRERKVIDELATQRYARRD